MSTQDAVRAALAELVALKDLNDIIAFPSEHADYSRRKPLAWEAARAALAAHAPPTALHRLAAFGAACLHAHRGTQACDVGDIDGGTAQYLALRYGVIEARTVTEKCSESCVCADVGEFPMECNFVPPDVAQAARALRGPQ